MTNLEKARANFENLIKQIRSFPLENWLHFLCAYDEHPEQNIKLNEISSLTTSIQRFQRIAIAHYSIRCTTIYRQPKRPFNQVEYIKAVAYYMNSEMRILEVAEGLHANAAFHALGSMAYEQFSKRQHPG